MALQCIFSELSARTFNNKNICISQCWNQCVRTCSCICYDILLLGKILKPVSESYEKQKRFITDASHEIKTPLTIIDANTEVIEMMEGENEWTNSTRKQVARLTSLTEKLVFLSRMDEEATKLEMLEFSLSDAILDTAEPFKAIARTKGKKLTIDVIDGILYTGDEKTIRQLVSILLDNAMKYSGCSSVSFEKDNINKKNLNKTNLNKTTQTQNDCVTTTGDTAPEIELTMRPSGKNRIITVWNTVDETANIKKADRTCYLSASTALILHTTQKQEALE